MGLKRQDGTDMTGRDRQDEAGQDGTDRTGQDGMGPTAYRMEPKDVSG